MVSYRIFSGLNGRGFAGEAAVPEGGEDVNPDNNKIIYRSSVEESKVSGSNFLLQ